MADIFDVIADPTRRDLLHLLLERRGASGSESAEGSGGEISVGDIVEQLGLSQPTVSKHLRVLRDHALVQVREEGQHRYYTLDPTPLEALEDWVIPFLTSDLVAADERSTVFAAWSGAQVPAPLRKAADTLQNPAGAGMVVGRKAAEASHMGRKAAGASAQRLHALQDATQSATQNVERRVIDPIKKKLGRREGEQ